MHTKCCLLLLLICGLQIFADDAPQGNEVTNEVDGVIKMMDPTVVGPGNMLPEWVKNFNKEDPPVLQQSPQMSPMSLTSTIRDALEVLRKDEQGARLPYDCDEALRVGKKSGVYKIELKNSYMDSFYAYCHKGDELNWMVIQRRMDGKLPFDRNWALYKRGFGDLTGEHWLGLDLINAITSSRPHELWITVQNHKNEMKNAYFSSFLIGSEESKYALRLLGNYIGNTGEPLIPSAGHEFSTKDNDNDAMTDENCAEKTTGGWWFGPDCGKGHLNGIYQDVDTAKGIKWDNLLGKEHSWKYVHMALRPVGNL